jgi:hypothetical protein
MHQLVEDGNNVRGRRRGRGENERKTRAFTVVCFKNIVSSETILLPLICNAY